MIRPMSATSAALLGLQASLRKFDQAAAVIARSGLETSGAPGADAPATSAASAPVPAVSDDDFLDAMINMIVAQRAFGAQLRVLETANDMNREAVHLGRDG